jgi:putative inorganic carbon (HCO3(-)) transporter
MINKFQQKKTVLIESHVSDVLQQVVFFLIGGVIFFNPFPHVTTIKEICFYLAAAITVGLLLTRKIKLYLYPPFLVPALLYAAWAFIGLFYALDKPNSINDYYSHLLKYIVLFYLIVNFYCSKKKIIILSILVIASAVLFAGGGLVYDYLMHDRSPLSRFGVEFIQTPINLFGIVTSLGIIFSLQCLKQVDRWWGKLLLFIGIVPLLFATVLTQTRGTILALGFGLVVLFWNKKKILFVLGLSLLVIIAFSPAQKRFASLATDGDPARMALGLLAVEIIKDYPVVGTGFGISTIRYPQFIDPNVYNPRIEEKYREIYKNQLRVPHNIFLSITVRTGLIGLGIFLWGMFFFVKMMCETITSGEDDFVKKWGVCVFASFVMFMTKGMLEPIFTHLTEVIFCLLVSMGTILWRLEKMI